ncbi:uncharacterized protein LOC112350380 [Selaginella moellendorffii]|uniref:uncharacterized protein LOC112350380 n=1 Tax=Selaginella moellendorffii TaxID=88036 RepID=UPI000D1C84B0|nr:uncharacterized protein LOC112350380 [Selaginella moellendorffii]|eukprot:XP_024542241.1 uncharacterized protein LOC112350380 [Selaginella moellendorffii]
MEGLIPVVGWMPCVGDRVAEWFRSGIGSRLLMVVRATFSHFGLELDHPPGAWFFEVLPNSTGTSTVSELKWKIWTVAVARVLGATVPDGFLHLFIAADYFTRHSPHQEQSRNPHPRPECCTGRCTYALIELHLLEEATDRTPSSFPLVITDEHVSAIVSILFPCTLSPTCVADAALLFDASGEVCDVVFTWLLLQLQSNKQPLEWLDAFEAQAIAGDRGGGGAGPLENLLLLFLSKQAALKDEKSSPASLDELKRIRSCIENAPRIEWKSMDITVALRQMLEEVMAAGEIQWDNQMRARLEQWIQGHYNFHRVEPLFQEYADVSVPIARLISTWMRTRKGRRDHAELKSLCSAATSSESIVEHIQVTMSRGSSDECRQLCDAAATVFGNDYGSLFVEICANVQWDPCLTACSLEEFGAIKQAAWDGLFRTASSENTLRRHRFDDDSRNEATWRPGISDMILYIAYLILEDCLGGSVDRETWKRDCESLLHTRWGGQRVSRGGKGVFVAISNSTRGICEAFAAWIQSPSTQRDLGASSDEIGHAIREAVVSAGGVEYDEERQQLWARMQELLGVTGNIWICMLARAYVQHEHHFGAFKNAANYSGEDLPTIVRRRSGAESIPRIEVFHGLGSASRI